MDQHQTVIVLDFGGQYNQLICRRVRDMGVYTELLPYSTSCEKIKKYHPIGIILTGGPNSVFSEDALVLDSRILDLGIPMLGICYGAQLLAHLTGGKVKSGNGKKEYGKVDVKYADDVLFADVPKDNVCWMSHTDHVSELGEGFVVTATTDNCPIAAYGNPAKKLYVAAIFLLVICLFS